MNTISKEYLTTLGALLAGNPGVPVISRTNVDLPGCIQFPVLIELVQDGDSLTVDNTSKEELMGQIKTSQTFLRNFYESWDALAPEQQAMFHGGDVHSAYQHCVDQYLDLVHRAMNRKPFVVL